MPGSPVHAYYDSYWREGGFNPETQPIPELAGIMERHIAREASCVDVGCGDGGTMSGWLASRVSAYVGVDVSESALATARARGLDVRKIRDASELPFEDRSFDAAICVEVLEHLLDPFGAAREMRRVLRPGGVLIVTTPNVAHWRNRADLAIFGRWNARGDDRSREEPWRDPHIRFFTRRTLAALLERCGFEVVDSGGYSDAPFVASIPGLRRLARPGRRSRAMDRLIETVPSVGASRVYAVARAVADAASAGGDAADAQ